MEEEVKVVAAEEEAAVVVEEEEEVGSGGKKQCRIRIGGGKVRTVEVAVAVAVINGQETRCVLLILLHLFFSP